MEHKGSLQIKGDRYYVVIGYKDEFGKRKQKWVRTDLDAKNNKTRATKALKDIVANFKVEDIYTNLKTTNEVLFGDFLKSWLEVHRRNIQYYTYKAYKIQTNKTADYFNNQKIKLKDLKPLHISAFYEVLRKKGLVENGILKYHVIIRKCLQYAVKNDLLNSNPADKVDRPKKGNFQASFLSKTEMETLFNYLEGHQLEVPIKLAALYGLRRSEIIGLKWDAINFENKTLEVRYKIVTLNNGETENIGSDRLKNKASHRTLPLFPQVEILLTKALKRIENNKKLFGSYYNKDYLEYVCVDEIGNLFRPDRLSHIFPSILKKAGLRHVRFHDLRHSCASLMLANGVSMKQIQEWLGHATFATTADVYSHLDYSSKIKSAEVLTNVFDFKAKNIENCELEEIDKEILRLQELKKSKQNDFEM